MRRKTLKVAFRELCAEVKSITAGDSLSLVEKFNQAMALATEFMAFARREKTMVAFASKFDEIYFFKFEKPEYYAQKIFLVGWFNLMNSWPRGTDEMLRGFLQEELKYISRFFSQYAFHYQYFRSGFTELDELLFLRGAEVKPVIIAEVPELDPGFSTAGDYLFSKFIAYELLQELILEELKKLDRPAVPVAVMSGSTVKSFSWTGDSINLVELGYALYLSKQLNGGKAGLTEIFRWLGELLGVEIGIPANRLREIKKRKRLDKVKFLALMQELLSDYIEKSISGADD